MEKERGIIIVGVSGIGKTTALELANKCDLPIVVDSQFTDLKEPEPFMITNTMLDVPEPFIDTSDIPNFRKHKMTCDKKRKKRKKRKRR
tara:strand:- start:9453 stop:9719 length:267 start_codon:yes stop_codon:yes gene_type:complete